MRPILAGDIFALANRLSQLPLADRYPTCARLLEETEWADKFRKKRGALHPQWGNGSLMGRIGVSSRQVSSSPAFQSPDFRASVVIALRSLEDWKRCKHRRECWVDLPKSMEKTEISP